MVGCCAFGCTNRADKGFKMFRIPSGKNDQERRKSWLAKIKRKDFNAQGSSRLCEVHFEDSQFEKNFHKKLKPNAVPTVFSHLPLQKHRKSPKKRQNSAVISPYSPKRSKECNENDISLQETDSSQLEEGSLQSFSLDADITLPPRDTVPLAPDLTQAQKLSDADITLPPRDTVPLADLTQVQKLSGPSDHPEDVIVLLKRRIQVLQKQVIQLEKEKITLENKYDSIWNPDQVRFLETNGSAHFQWSDETVKKALQVWFACGPTGYQLLLDQGFPLPSDRTLRRRLQPIAFSSGIIDEVFAMLADKVPALAKEERQVSLTLDEMAIQPSLDLDRRSNGVLGFPTVCDANGLILQDTLATHALVFMLHGLSTPWKQAVAYEFTGNSCSALVIKKLILDIISKAHTIGLEVKSVTMDMGGGNQAVLREFGVHCARSGDISNTVPHPVIEDEKLCFFTDFPHLLKNLRNHLTKGQTIYLPPKTVLKHNLPCNDVNIRFIKDLLNLNEKSNLKLTPHLKESYLNPSHFEKMKVAPAQVLMSRRTAAALRTLVDQKLLPENALTTAWFLEQVGMWYDLVSSRSNKTALSKHNLKKLNSAVVFLNDFISLIRHCHIGAEKAPWKPVQKGIVISTTSALSIKEDLVDTGNFGFVCLGRFTQDGLENLFSIIRFKNPVPTALEFKNALRIITVSQLLKATTKGSYVPDDCVQLVKGLPLKPPMKDVTLEPIPELPNELKLSEMEKMALYNLAGYCIKKYMKLNRNCEICLNFATSNERPSISDFTTELCYSYNSLTFVSKPVFTLLELAEKVVVDFNVDVLKSENVLKRLVNETTNRYSGVDFPQCHQLFGQLLMKYFRVRVFSFLREKKQELKSKKKLIYRQEAESSRSLAMRASLDKK